MKASKRIPFQKGHKKIAGSGRKKGQLNRSTLAIKELLNLHLPDDVLWKYWDKKLKSRDEHIALKALEMAAHYKYGKPVQPIVGEEFAPPIQIDISAIPRRLIPA